MPTRDIPTTQARIIRLRDQTQAACDELARAPLTERLSTLTDLDTALTAICEDALRAAATDARAAGWSLRRIGATTRRSHEQIRTLTNPATRPAGSGPTVV